MALTNMGFTATATKPSQKRKSSSMSLDSDADAPPPGTKKAKASTKSAKVLPISTKPLYTAHDLALLSHADLIAYTMNLQKQLEVSKKSPASAAVGQELSPEDLKKKVEHLRTLMVRQIKKAMTWKPSCKTGSATFSQDFVVQSPQIIKKLFETVVKDAKNGKEWKMKKFSAEKFEGAVGSIEASVRYDYLELTSDVTVRWDAENGTMKCSGKYGKPGTGVLAAKKSAASESD